MKVIVINKDGFKWEFDSVAQAKPQIKKNAINEYTTETRNEEKVRVYDDRCEA